MTAESLTGRASRHPVMVSLRSGSAFSGLSQPARHFGVDLRHVGDLEVVHRVRG
jgi:hypothetical protein